MTLASPSSAMVLNQFAQVAASGTATASGRTAATERLTASSPPASPKIQASNVASPKEREERRAKILAEWKANPAELVQRFDEDGDGRVDMAEWELARKAADALVEENVAKAAMKPDIDVLMKGEEGHPFILSTKSQDELTGVYRWRALAGLLVFLAGGVALGVTLTARLGG